MDTEFLVYEELAIPMILGSNFMDGFVTRINFIPQQLVLVDRASVQLLRTVSTELHTLPSHSTMLEGRSARPSPKVRAARRTTLKSGTQTWITVTGGDLDPVQSQSPPKATCIHPQRDKRCGRARPFAYADGEVLLP